MKRHSCFFFFFACVCLCAVCLCRWARVLKAATFGALRTMARRQEAQAFSLGPSRRSVTHFVFVVANLEQGRLLPAHVKEEGGRLLLFVRAHFHVNSWLLLQVHGDSTFDVRFDDGDFEAGVPAKFLASLAYAGQAALAVAPATGTSREVLPSPKASASW
jgi:hypothetical protein